MRRLRFIDISREISAGMEKYPSDPAVKVAQFKSLKQGDSCNLAGLTLGSHSGTHVDAPRHIFNQGKSVDKIRPEYFFCDVYVSAIGKFFQDLALKRISLRGIAGVLFKAQKNRAFLTVAQAVALAAIGLKIVGIEGLSIEGPGDKAHPVHRLLLGKDIQIIEGLELGKVKTGRYKLICLPLKIKNGDGAPARAILIDD